MLTLDNLLLAVARGGMGGGRSGFWNIDILDIEKYDKKHIK